MARHCQTKSDQTIGARTNRSEIKVPIHMISPAIHRVQTCVVHAVDSSRATAGNPCGCAADSARHGEIR